MTDIKNPHTGSSIETLEEEEVSQEITQGNETVRPRRGRPRKPEVMGANEVEARFQELMDTLEESPDPQTRTLEEIVDFNKKIITMVQDILFKDLKTISPKNTARISTPNGIQKFEIGGLTPATREYLLKILDNCFKAVSLQNEKDVSNNEMDENKLASVAKQLFNGLPEVKD